MTITLNAKMLNARKSLQPIVFVFQAMRENSKVGLWELRFGECVLLKYEI
jgi:hypothetical protein